MLVVILRDNHHEFHPLVLAEKYAPSVSPNSSFLFGGLFHEDRNCPIFVALKTGQNLSQNLPKFDGGPTKAYVQTSRFLLPHGS